MWRATLPDRTESVLDSISRFLYFLIMIPLVGTSGFQYTAWRGTFYPEKFPPEKLASDLAALTGETKAEAVDCFSYALAKATGFPLLFKGEDFGKTDIQAAM
jgi:hypothetical protein